MPTIPTAQRRVREQIGPAAKVTQRADLDAFGGGTKIAQGLSNIAGAVDKVRVEARDQAENTQLRELQIRENKFRNESLHNKETGFMNTRMKQSADQFGTYTDSYDKFIEEEMGGITSQRVKDKYKLYAGDSKNQMSAQMNRHAGNEMQKYQMSNNNAALVQLEEDAVLNYRDITVPDENGTRHSIINSSIKKQNDLIDEMAKNRGLSPEVTKGMKLKSSSDVHTKITAKLIDEGSHKQAEKYLENAKKKKELTVDAIDRLEKAVNNSNVRGKSQDVVTDIMSRGLSDQDALEAIRTEIDDPEVQDASVARYKNRSSEAKALKKHDDEQFYQGLGDQLFANPAEFKLTAQMNERLTFSQQKSLEVVASRAKKDKLGGKDLVTNRSVYLDMLRDPDLSYDKLIENQGSLSLSDYKFFGKAIKDDSILENARSEAAYAEDIVRSAIGVSNYKAGKNGDEALFIRSMITDKLSHYPKDQRRSPKVQKEVRDEVLKEEKVKRAWTDWDTWDAKEPAWQLGFQGKTPERPKNLAKNFNYVDSRDSNGKAYSGFTSPEDANGRQTVYDSDGNDIGHLEIKG